MLWLQCVLILYPLLFSLGGGDTPTLSSECKIDQDDFTD